MTVSALSYQQLYSTCDLDFLSFETTRDLADLNQPLGQEEAINAINFGISMNSYGYNLFCIGSEGTGKSSLVRQILTKAAKKRKTPDDWCYVYNFNTPYKPAAIRMPAGKAKIFAKAVDKLIEEIRVALPAVFDGDEYRAQMKAIDDAFRDQKTKYYDEIQKNTTGKNVSVLRMPVGLVVAPTKDGDVLSPEAFEKLSEEEQQEVLAELNAAQEELENAEQVLGADYNMPAFDVVETDYGPAMIRITENDAQSDYADFVTVWHGYLITLALQKSAPLTDADMDLAVRIASDMWIVEE